MTYRHPPLFDGYNSTANNRDEVDGSGQNYPPVSPLWLLSFESMDVIIITPDMMAIFDEGYPDLVIHPVPNTVILPRETRSIDIIGAEP